MSGPLFDEGLLRILNAGGCQCDPPGVGEEFCTGHCHLRAEVAQLRTDLAQAQAKRDEWKARAETDAGHAAESANKLDRWRLENSELRAQVTELQQQLKALEG
jgi:predicted nuclease with TOPRIM domain